MPYIARKDRARYQRAIDELAALVPQDRTARPGHMNYIISLLIRRVYGESIRYADHNEVVGLLNCVQQEFYRRATAPYEDEKIAQEGDLTDL
ncbi:MAG: hypothetical protein KJZ69_14025 [Phycisphaerales bacterium]|nr:hypothetical protein [Phycisphaerales bacterium]